MIRRYLAAALLAWCFCGNALAAMQFPALTGRVVDNAHMLSAGNAARLTDMLAAHEQQTGNQLVVVTLPSLTVPIEEYGVALGRHWGIGQKGKDNGVLLIISPTTHDVRIEVGYGLEGRLTDALSSQIIQQIIVPDFKAGNMEEGIMDGATAIITVLEGKAVSMEPPQPRATPEASQEDILRWVSILGFFLFIFICAIIFPSFRRALFWILLTGGGRGGRGGGSGGGFSGGGGSFGGGGSSGKW